MNHPLTGGLLPLACPRAATRSAPPSGTRLFCQLVLLLSLALCPAAWAQNPAGQPTGQISGRVLDPATGRYLNNARVTLAGTGRTVFTNQYGEYRLTGVPAGEAKLRVFYSGLGEQTITVNVPAGGAVTQDLTFGRAPSPDQPLVLDTYTVAGSRETNVAAIAVNEQRFAPNIKTVIETDAFGDVTEGNVGEFLKFLPGVTVDYVAADVRTVSVRGFGAAFTSVYVDGFRMASASSGSSQRAFEFEQVSINNASRVEITKVPTPAMPADALGGSVNLISKNAFEREGAQFNYRAYLNLNSEDTQLFQRTPGPKNDRSYKALPGFDFDYTLPVTKDLGFVITGLSSNQFNEQHRSQTTWNFAQGGATPADPFLQQYTLQDGPKNSFRDSFSVKMDWRISPASTLSVGYQINYYKSFFGNRNLNWDAGSNPAPSDPAGTPLTWSSTFTEGATGRGTVRHGSSFRDKLGATNSGMIKYRFNGESYEIEAGAAMSSSRSWYRDLARGHFSEVRTTLQDVSRVTYQGIDAPRPAQIQAQTATGEVIDPGLLQNYRINTVRSVPLDAKDEFRTAHLNVKRELDALPFPAALTAGADVRVQDRDITRRDMTWNFVGADHLANTADDSAAPYRDPVYDVDNHWGFSHLQWPDPFLLWDTFKTHPDYFAQTADQVRNAERFRIQNSQDLTETITAFFLQADAKFLDNKLSITTGVRFEQTSDKGKGPLTPTAGATFEDVHANWRERGLSVSKRYDGYYPSLHVNYNLTENLIARFAYARTLGRPDFSNILPLARINETETSYNDGIGEIPARTIIYNNTALDPWEGDSWDASLEYYFRNGGVLSAGLFRKDIDGFFGTRSVVATPENLAALNLGPEYAGFQLQTRFNTDSTARITGGELNFRQPLTFIPGIGDLLTFTFNATKLNLEGSAEADFRGFIEESANAGLTFNWKKLTARVNVNYRGRQINSPQTGSAYGGSANRFYEYFADRYNVDLNAEYRFSPRFGLFANARNVFNVPQELERYNDVSPAYSHLYRAEEFGVQITAGVKGTF